MERGSWSQLTGDSGIWKKLALGGVCFLTVLPIPVALGAVLADLETETEKMKSKEASGAFPDFDNPLSLLGKGLAPSFIFVLAVMLFSVPTVVVFMSLGFCLAPLKSELDVSVVSWLLAAMFGVLALVLQFLCAVLFPVAVAQYARGMAIRSAVDPLANLGYIMDMGAPFGLKASGWWFFMTSFMVLFVVTPPWWLSLLIQLALAALGFASLVVSSRFALAQLQNKL